MSLSKTLSVLGAASAVALASVFTAAASWAEEPLGQPHPWQLNLQRPVGPVQQGIDNLHDLLLIITTAICVLVLALLAYVLVRFNARKNPVPSNTSHNTLVEIAWTVLPVFVLIVIAIPSFKLLYFQDVVPEAELTIKATGHQWYWSYEYPDQGGFAFDAVMVPKEEIKPGQLRLLSTDNNVVVPVDTVVRVQITGNDVLHSWAVPSFGVKRDAVPGRLNETWFKADREGVFYGQCSEICGAYHAFMPIAVEVVSKEAFQRWVGEAKEKFAHAGDPAVRLARSQAQSGGE